MNKPAAELRRTTAAEHHDLRAEIVATCRTMNRNGLNQGTSGNVSHRIDGGLLITPTSLPYDCMTPDDIVALGYDGVAVGSRRPSSEWRFHRDILAVRADMNVVLHTHSIYATTLAVHERSIPPFHYMIAVAGGDDIRCAPYACFGTQALSDHALTALDGRKACLLAHHGLIVLGETFERAVWLAIEVEALAKIFVHALSIGEPPLLSADDMAAAHAQFSSLQYGRSSGPKPAARETDKAANEGDRAHRAASDRGFTCTQGQYLAFIDAYVRVNGRAPAEADLQAHFGVTAPSVHQMVLTLERRGLIRRTPGAPRSIEILIDAAQLPELHRRRGAGSPG